MMKKIIFTGAIITVFFCICAFILYGLGVWRFNYPKEYAVHGIDVSHHQGDINWPSVPKDRVQFVYIKATEGGDFRDGRFEKNWEDARQNGLRVGAYHFFTFCKSGEEQAQNFIATVPVQDNSLPPVIDLEFVGNCSKRPGKKAFGNELDDFVLQIKGRYGTEPILYTTYAFFNRYLEGSAFEKYPFWVRDVLSKPSPKNFPDWVIWQYADNANVPGIYGRVDLNVAQERLLTNDGKHQIVP